ncbi:F0F1 ATP synthase subunit gamma [Actinomycetospora sp. NBRC 106378]|jgi:F-type H+-transporting ATPase subunit gamma|uniref:F0F1 ATP synthase subunit gamma n=1 Tax=Actinomycetospora sp. NBRC 106378 TaxID=3032208 RepID=UPI0024A09EDC|nr:F0F1 ATP synthase subunit gamma [Actinomycetospora sp. NBRC 106378]GLZ54720.1 ATP synthase gamma chain [Actinomycetospora sp. NBRC 106378]
MAANLRVLRRRIKSTKNIAQITKAMEMVAASRISKAQARVEASRPYADEFTHVLKTAAKAGASDHPLLTPREEPKRAAIVVVTSDRGLCGGYNANVLRETERLIRRLSDEGKESTLYVIGGKGTAYFRFRNREMSGQFTGFSEVPDYANAAHAADHLTAAFLAGGENEVTVDWDSDDEADSGAERKVMFRAPQDAEGKPGVDEIHVVFTQFQSMMTQTATALQVAPLDLESEEDDEGSESSSSSDDSDGSDREAEYAFEPEPEVLFDSLLPKYVRARVFAAMLDAAASESAARQRAMKAATDNANDLVDNLVRESNQARQAQITQEISEIVGGSDALAQ